MNSDLYDSENNGSGYSDEITFGKEKHYNALNNVDLGIDDVYKDLTETDGDGYGEYEDDGYDDSWE